MTMDGVIGYVKEKHVKPSYYKEILSTFTSPEYTAQADRKNKFGISQIFNKKPMKAGRINQANQGSKCVSNMV